VDRGSGEIFETDGSAETSKRRDGQRLMSRRWQVEATPWVLIAGGFHDDGGMDQLNAGLARYLLSRGTPVHLIAYRVNDELAKTPGAQVHVVKKIAGSFFLGQKRLDRRGRAIAKWVDSQDAAARVLVNGANCAWPDINWVHFVHHSWAPRRREGPRWLQLKNWLEGSTMLDRERKVLGRARLLIANSERTRRDLVERVGLPAERIVRIYPGSSKIQAVSGERKLEIRRMLGIASATPVVIFVGALGHDSRKGFDTLWAAWQRLCMRSDWGARLIVAGEGRALESWRRRVCDAGLGDRVLMAGFTKRIADLLAISDLMVSPARYEPYGMNVHEAVSAGVPAMISAAAGIAELYPSELRDMLLDSPQDANDLVERLLRWSAVGGETKRRFEKFTTTLRERTVEQMAGELVEAIETSEAGRIALSNSGFRV
jgi:glycosyltransferase involved in cell wall biosynthesis